jgi:hypothetical protein
MVLVERSFSGSLPSDKAPEFKGGGPCPVPFFVRRDDIARD